jgi:phenylacetate-CoA ligase
MHNLLGRSLYRTMDMIRGEGILTKLQELLRRQYAGAEEIRSLQARKLSALLQHARKSVPFYRDRWKAGDPLSAIPPLDKQDIQAAGEDLLDADPSERYRWEVTSGSTGTPMSCRRSLTSYGWHRANNLRSLDWYGVRPGDRQARIWGVPILAVERRRERCKDFLLNRTRISAFDLDPADVSRNLRRMAGERPGYLYGYPSAIHALSRFILDGNSRILGTWRPQVVMTSAELLFPDQKREIEDAFRCPVSNEYGASELTVMASTCPEGTLHLNEESVVTEFEPTDLVIDGKAAYRLIFTDLNNFSMPLIRYRIGDLARPLDGPCPCGLNLASMEILGGREVDVLVTPSGGRIHGSIFSYLGKSILIRGGVRQFRSVQVRPDLLEIEFSRGPGFDSGCLTDMEAEVHARAGAEVEVVFREVDRILPEPSGKLRYFISRIDERERQP